MSLFTTQRHKSIRRDKCDSIAVQNKLAPTTAKNNLQNYVRFDVFTTVKL